ncbi:uncharacterized protein LOC143624712 [Bidens hawaiensis]|uniref:uncharacterized protein LOC143624712 n=1 Tax=Bidens hawaiensis TaxID=980011 RepID=UPI00404B2E0C
MLLKCSSGIKDDDQTESDGSCDETTKSPKSFDSIPNEFFQSFSPPDVYESFAGWFNGEEVPHGNIDFRVDDEDETVSEESQVDSSIEEISEEIVPTKGVPATVVKVRREDAPSSSTLHANMAGQNGVAERKNMTLIETARELLADSKLPLLSRRNPNLKWLELFRSNCTVLDPNGKFGAKPVEGFLLVMLVLYDLFILPSINRIMQVQHVDCQRYATPNQRKGDSWINYYTFNDDPTPDVDDHVDDTPATPSFDDDGVDHNYVIEPLIQPIPTSDPVLSDEVANDENVTNLQPDVVVSDEVIPCTLSYHPEENILGDLNTGLRTRSQIDQSLSCYYTQVAPLQNRFSFKCFISQIKPKTYKQALTEESWVNAIQEELLQFEKLGETKLDWWFLVSIKGMESVTTKSMLPLLDLKLSIFLAFASWKWFKVYLLDVKSVFLNGKLGKEAYVGQPPGFIDPIHKDNVFVRSTVNCTLFTKKVDGHLLIVQTKYVKDILKKFNMADSSPISTPNLLNHGIGSDPTGEKVDETLYRSMIVSLMYLTASRPDIMYPTCLCARYQSSPRVSHLTLVKRTLRYLKGCPWASLWYPRDDVFELRVFSDSDYGSCKLNAKSTTADC